MLPESFMPGSSTPQCKAAILCRKGEDTVRLGERLWALPVSAALS